MKKGIKGWLTPKSSILAIFVMVALGLAGCGGVDDPKPEPPDPGGNGGTDTTQYLGSYAKNLKGLEKAVEGASKSFDPNPFGTDFWSKAIWGRYGTAGSVISTAATQPQDFLNDNVIKDLLAAKPEDWDSFGSGSATFKRYIPKNQTAFSVVRTNPDYPTWVWFMHVSGTRPTGGDSPTLRLRLQASNGMFVDVCAWYLPE